MQEEAPQYSKPVAAPLPDAAAGDAAGVASKEEPDHLEAPPLPPEDAGFDGPSGSFR
jgi:hypothetical protein